MPPDITENEEFFFFLLTKNAKRKNGDWLMRKEVEDLLERWTRKVWRMKGLQIADGSRICIAVMTSGGECHLKDIARL